MCVCMQRVHLLSNSRTNISKFGFGSRVTVKPIHISHSKTTSLVQYTPATQYPHTSIHTPQQGVIYTSHLENSYTCTTHLLLLPRMVNTPAAHIPQTCHLLLERKAPCVSHSGMKSSGNTYIWLAACLTAN